MAYVTIYNGSHFDGFKAAWRHAGLPMKPRSARVAARNDMVANGAVEVGEHRFVLFRPAPEPVPSLLPVASTLRHMAASLTALADALDSEALRRAT